ncbi:hypothetical protein HUZ36_15830 [Pseudoalteromonas sp. McH1-7]|uniref:Uncharacterized protein n=1 Tax=Pseudoalteromonas peptidolytica F12-50-A1 TaxID=1315280 RepID=A0A8I0N0L5_9GAMM|nr:MULTISPECIES: hypothetical protein [Pseudoalteromonas]MBE0348641.1 hypothetical protein [Pseudoalteromonas peptidolytica F12-50-A1]MDW7548513.1 hypothetical protein [Pseudoalteromonas peptidolytica]NLR15740.1 hypothetical protein [Pseudoalteromonas peptidolytica]NUZ12253.1 hypothetical protein [Pseudoalteromonas sp. McH1-7]RRS07555.1 hypothetical protein EAG18_16680 [Pseudoalteromonas sp. J010]
MKQDNLICDFGLHAGEPYSSLPASFLNWMVETGHDKREYAKVELNRRVCAAENSNRKFSDFEC